MQRKSALDVLRGLEQVWGLVLFLSADRAWETQGKYTFAQFHISVANAELGPCSVSPDNKMNTFWFMIKKGSFKTFFLLSFYYAFLLEPFPAFSAEQCFQ